MHPLRACATATIAATFAISCGSSSTPSAHTPSASAAATASPSPSPSGPLGEYGLLMPAGSLELIDHDGKIAAETAVAPAATQTCAAGMAAVLPPPVSATSDKVFFRDGDTRIRYLTPGGQTGDATTVPGGPTKVSLFAVSPDDQRIAVLVEDLSDPANIGLRMYVEDLIGNGHHVDILVKSTPNGKPGITLWPMGWHQSQLVLAVVPSCTFESVSSPLAWQVVDAASGAQVALISGTDCLLSWWPSPAGVACAGAAGQAAVYGWDGKVIRSVAVPPGDSQSSLSPLGTGIAFTPGFGIGAPSPSTTIIGSTASVTVPGHEACLWIDEDHVLAPDAVLAFPSGAVAAVPASGACAGRFPGGL
jgi:hypothetical protein